MVCPTGHQYRVNEDNFNNQFPCYLQIFEFALLAQPILDLCEKFPDSKLLGHYPDGNVILLKKETHSEAISYIRERVQECGKSLGLKSLQDLEIKRVHQ